MPKLKTLSGKDVVKILEKFGFFVSGQKGSHTKLKRTKGEDSQILTIPNHKELDKGTLKAIYNQSLRYLSDEEMRDHFYGE